jgi:signal transduction histidine kinase
MVRSDDGKACGAAIFFKDLTRIEHTEEQERLKDRLAALGQMAASMAHEIRNPLASIDVTCKLLQRRLGTEHACGSLLERVADEVKRLESTISSSLEFVRPLKPRLASGEIVPLLEEAIGIAEGRRGKPGILLRRRFSGGIPAFQMDAGLLRQVFVNLLLNAMEACGEQGTVTVEAEIIDAPTEPSVPYRPDESRGSDPLGDVLQFAVVRVSDTGQGIDEAKRDRIFYPFFTTKKQGSGVGLAMAKKIVGSHRGLIDVESTPGEGAEFLVRLPLVTTQAEV